MLSWLILHLSNTYYIGDIKVLPEKSQPKFSLLPKFPGLWERIVHALGTNKTGEIAKICGISDSSVSEWKKQGKPPSLLNLLKISDLGNTSINWLLTGKEPNVGGGSHESGADMRIDLDDLGDLFIRRLAAAERKTPDQMAMELLSEALKARGAELFGDYEKYTPEQLKEILDVAFIDTDGVSDKRKTHLK